MVLGRSRTVVTKPEVFLERNDTLQWSPKSEAFLERKNFDMYEGSRYETKLNKGA